MSEFLPVKTVEDLNRLDEKEIVAGYMDGIGGVNDEPGSDKSRSYWHGWRNAMTDRGMTQCDDAQRMLSREVVGTYRGLN